MSGRDYDVVQGFDAIAPKYDLANDAISFGLHRRWRRRLCRRADELTPRGGTLLDVATGTGDVILGLIGRRPDLRFVGVDPSARMVSVARRKFAALPAEAAARATLKEGDARRLPFPDAAFDAVACAWGVRNIRPFEDGLREMLRVLKPGGALVVLESGRPDALWVRPLHWLYSRVLPAIGGAITGYQPAYEYYARTADLFPSGPAFAAVLREAGFATACAEGLWGGIVSLYSARKPSR